MSTFPGAVGNFATRAPAFLSPFPTLPPGFGSAPLLGIPTQTLVPTLAIGGGILPNPGAPLQAVFLPPAISQPVPHQPPSQSTAQRVLESLPWPSKVNYFPHLIKLLQIN